MTPEESIVAAEVAGLLHKGNRATAAQRVCDSYGIRMRPDEKQAVEVLQHYLHVLLEKKGIPEAARLLWTPNQVCTEIQYTKDLWNFFDSSDRGLIMGAASCSKSYAMGVRVMLAWIEDPEYTTVKLIGPSEDHLEANLFSDMVRLWQTASLPMPGEVGELFIGLDRRNQTSTIQGLVIPVGNMKKSGRLQGVKRKPRPTRHPRFGERTRVFVFIDEFENVPKGVFKDIDNILSQVSEEGDVQGFKLIGAFNPGDIAGEVAKRAEPPFGWQNLDPDKHFRWKSLRGWEVLRLDGEKSENVVAGKIVYPGLQTRDGLEAIALNAGGRNTAGYLSQGRGMYALDLVELTLIPPGYLPKMRAEYIWYDENPSPIVGCDLALEGGAATIYTLGKAGLATGIKYPPSLQFPTGNTVLFKNDRGTVVPRWGIQAEHIFTLPKGDTIVNKDNIISLNRKTGVRPEAFSVDRTGHGAGVADLIKHEWSSSINAVNYSEGCTAEKLFTEDTETCFQLYDRIHSELWFVFQRLAEFNYVLIHPSLDISALSPEVTQRRYRSVGKTRKIESKKDYKSRGYSSPDYADSFMLMVHSGRRIATQSFSMTGAGDAIIGGYDDSDWYQYQGGARIDESNRTDWLSDAERQPWEMGMEAEIL